MAANVAFVICDDHRGLLARRGFLEFRRALLSVDFRIFVGLPPATEVWLRYASPQVASLINGVNDRGAVIERRRSRSVFPRSGTSVDHRGLLARRGFFGVSTRVAIRRFPHFCGLTPGYRGVAALRFATSRFAH